MKILNSRGTMTTPWDTPAFISIEGEME